jgi:hypothetical protein
MATEERYQENLRQQAEDILKSWGLVKETDGSWRDPKWSVIKTSRGYVLSVEGLRTDFKYTGPRAKRNAYQEARIRGLKPKNEVKETK